MQHAKTLEDRFACLEHVVQARVGALEYLNAFHTLMPATATSSGNNAAAPAAAALWLDTVALTRADVVRHYDDEGSAAGRSGSASPAYDRASPAPASPSGGLRALNNARKHGRVAEVWLEKHVGRWFDLGYALARLLVQPSMAAGPSFVGAINELLLELDHSNAEGNSAKRALAHRALRHDREDRGVALQRPPVGSGYVFHVAPPRRFGRPSYVRTVASLLSTLVLTYRKLVDSDIAADASAYRRFCRFDEFVDSHVIGVITRELDHLARWKVAAEADAVMELVLVAAAAPTGAPPPSAHVDPSQPVATAAAAAAAPAKKSGWRSWFGGSSSKAAPPSPAPLATPPPLSPSHVRTSSLASTSASELATPVSSTMGRYTGDA